MSFFILLICVGCSSDKVDTPMDKLSYDVKYELEYVEINGEKSKPSVKRILEFGSNTGNITTVLKNDSITLGVEFVVFEFEWKKEGDKYFVLIYYERDKSGDWKKIKGYFRPHRLNLGCITSSHRNLSDKYGDKWDEINDRFQVGYLPDSLGMNWKEHWRKSKEFERK